VVIPLVVVQHAQNVTLCIVEVGLGSQFVQQYAYEVKSHCCLSLVAVSSNVGFALLDGDECLPVRRVLRYPDVVGPGLAQTSSLWFRLLASCDYVGEALLVETHEQILKLLCLLRKLVVR